MHTTATSPEAGKGTIERRGRPVGSWVESSGVFFSRTIWGDFTALTLLALVSIIEHAGKMAEAKARASKRAKTACQRNNTMRQGQVVAHRIKTPLTAFSAFVAAYAAALVAARQRPAALLAIRI